MDIPIIPPYFNSVQATLTSRWQITISVSLRRRLKLHAGDRLEFDEQATFLYHLHFYSGRISWFFRRWALLSSIGLLTRSLHARLALSGPAIAGSIQAFPKDLYCLAYHQNPFANSTRLIVAMVLRTVKAIQPKAWDKFRKGCRDPFKGMPSSKVMEELRGTVELPKDK